MAWVVFNTDILFSVNGRMVFFILEDRGVQSWPMGEGVGQRSLWNGRLTAAVPPVPKALARDCSMCFPLKPCLEQKEVCYFRLDTLLHLINLCFFSSSLMTTPNLIWVLFFRIQNQV